MRKFLAVLTITLLLAAGAGVSPSEASTLTEKEVAEVSLDDVGRVLLLLHRH